MLEKLKKILSGEKKCAKCGSDKNVALIKMWRRFIFLVSQAKDILNTCVPPVL